VAAKARWRTLGDDSIISRRLFIFNPGFVNQHHRNVVTNRIDAFAFFALQSALVSDQFHSSAAGRTNKNLEQLFANGHRKILNLNPIQAGAGRRTQNARKNVSLAVLADFQ
jgi:hypothetical protein